MKLYRVFYNNAVHWALETKDARLQLLTQAPYEAIVASETIVARSDVALLVPTEPSKIVAVGRNYQAHAKELGNEVPAEPLLFLTPPSALLAHDGVIVLPSASSRVEHEAELAVVIKKRASRISVEEALSYVLGYTCANDVTARDLQRKDVQFTRGKGFDTFCPVGPHLETTLDPSALSVSCLVNQETRQHGNTRDMIFSVPFLISFISHIMTLEAGDLILTGTPAGVSAMQDGDHVSVTIESIGTLDNRCRAAF